jgi:hypothetical protein
MVFHRQLPGMASNKTGGEYVKLTARISLEAGVAVTTARQSAASPYFNNTILRTSLNSPAAKR